MSVRESAIESKSVQDAEAKGWWQIKIMKASKRGIPDRLFIRDGRAVFIEFKAPHELPSRQQKLKIEEILNHGVEAYWASSVEECNDLLR